MALNLKEIQAKLLAQQAMKDRVKNGGFAGDNAVYAFWNNPTGSQATLRFLPDGDESNGFFWVERLIIKLPFTGIKGQADNKPIEVQVPCTDMWKPKSCPITAEITPWWKDKSLEDMARKYYRKKSYLFQGFVVSNPNKEDQEPENPIRRFMINASVFDVIKSVLMDKDLEHSPTDYEHGRDFYLVKNLKGDYANYTSSKWAMKERNLSEQENEAISKFGLWNLSSFLPKKPDEAHLNAIVELFNASVNEELYDIERWGQFYKPTGLRFEKDSAAENTDTETTSTKTSSVEPPWAEPATLATPTSTASSILNNLAAAKASNAGSVSAASSDKPKAQSPDDILAAIRRRQQQK